VHFGHYHTEVTKDTGGTMVRQFGTPKNADEYEQKNGFTMGSKILKILEFDESGLLAEYTLKGL